MILKDLTLYSMCVNKEGKKPAFAEQSFARKPYNS